LKEDYDGAEPSASSVGVANLLALAHLTGDAAALKKAEATLRMFGQDVGRGARAVPMMMAALSQYHAGASQIAVVGPRDRSDTAAILSALGSRYDPFSITIPIEPGDTQQQLGERLPFISGMTMKDGRATAYICRDFVCEEPVNDLAGLHARFAR
jgi:uncharacterized protein YyaL (SSP411 family)